MKESALLRLIDRYIGIVLCFFLSLFRKKRPLPQIRKVLFIELFEMGAAIMAYSSLKYAKERYPDAELYCLCVKGNQQSWELLGLMPNENILTIDGKNFFLFAKTLLKQLWNLRKLDIDIVVDFEKFARISVIIGALSKAKFIAGFHRYEHEGLYRGALLDVPCSFNQNQHISKNFLALTKTALANADDLPNYKGPIQSDEIRLPEYQSNAAIRLDLIQRILKIRPQFDSTKLVVIAPDVGGNLVVRNYPHYAEVIRGLIRLCPDHSILLVGTPENQPICQRLAAEVASPNCINFCSQTNSVQELTELLSLASLFIGNDNGPAHFASLTRTKILALFSTDSPYMYGPLGNCVILYTHFHCSPCITAYNHKRSRCSDNRCLQTLPPERVCQFAERILTGKEIKYRSINGIQDYL